MRRASWAVGEGAFLLNAHHADFCSCPKYSRAHVAPVESLPFGALAFPMQTLMNGTPRSDEGSRFCRVLVAWLGRVA